MPFRCELTHGFALCSHVSSSPGQGVDAGLPCRARSTVPMETLNAEVISLMLTACSIVVTGVRAAWSDYAYVNGHAKKSRDSERNARHFSQR